MDKTLTVKNEKEEEYEVQADSNDNVWLRSDEEVVKNPFNLSAHIPSHSGSTHIRQTAANAVAIVLALAVGLIIVSIFF